MDVGNGVGERVTFHLFLVCMYTVLSSSVFLSLQQHLLAGKCHVAHDSAPPLESAEMGATFTASMLTRPTCYGRTIICSHLRCCLFPHHLTFPVLLLAGSQGAPRPRHRPTLAAFARCSSSLYVLLRLAEAVSSL